MRRFSWIPAFARMTEKRLPFVIPNLIGNPGLCLFYFLVLLCFSTKDLDTTNGVVNALPPAIQSSAEASKLQEAPGSAKGFAEASPTQRGERDPFWPIGYVAPLKHGGTLESAKYVAPAIDKKTAFQAADLSGMLKIGGVIRSNGKFYATINGFTVQTGEVVTAVTDGEVYKFVVEKIDLKKVQIRPIK